MKNILVWGNGFIGSHLAYDKIQERASTDPNHIKATLKAYKPDVLINCIGFTGRPNIDQCEIEKEKTFTINTIIPSIIANECDKLGIHHIMMGSGCIFSGKSPHSMMFSELADDSVPFEVDTGWRETDPANPVSYYSNTKYACDLLIGSLPTTAILRIRMPISSKNDPRNFITKVRHYKQIIDIPNSITIVSDLVRCIDWAIENNKTGIYNVVNGKSTAAEVMRKYKKYDRKHQFTVINENELNKLTTAKRSNCIIDGSKLRNEGFRMRPAEEALEQTMKEYIENLRKDNQ